ncbi:unnamed protein product, partial [Urochloa humidicola]
LSAPALLLLGSRSNTGGGVRQGHADGGGEELGPPVVAAEELQLTAELAPPPCIGASRGEASRCRRRLEVRRRLGRAVSWHLEPPRAERLPGSSDGHDADELGSRVRSFASTAWLTPSPPSAGSNTRSIA